MRYLLILLLLTGCKLTKDKDGNTVIDPQGIAPVTEPTPAPSPSPTPAPVTCTGKSITSLWTSTNTRWTLQVAQFDTEQTVYYWFQGSIIDTYGYTFHGTECEGTYAARDSSNNHWTGTYSKTADRFYLCDDQGQNCIEFN